jgi:hypothetical protein
MNACLELCKYQLIKLNHFHELFMHYETLIVFFHRYASTMLWSGSKLQSVKDVYIESIQYAEQHNIVNNFLTVAFHLIVELLGETAQYDVPTEDKLTSPHQLTINQLMIL